jgi:hypothetical protein
MPKSEVGDGTDFRPPQSDDATDITSTGQAFFSDPLEQLAPAGHLGSREQIEAELDMIAASIRTFHRLQPDQVLRYCAGYTARLTELRVLLHRVESLSRQYTRLRTQQVDKYVEELDRQWKTASRLVEVMRQDLYLSGAQT